MTILFDMRNLTPVEREVWYDALINRVFHYDQKINTLLKTFVRESTTGIPYMNSLMLCLLTETIIRLLQGTYASPMAPASSTAHQSAMDELFDRIITYINDNIYDPSPSRRSASTSRCPGPLCSCCSRTRWTSRPKSISNDKKAGAQLSDAPRETAIPSARFRCVWATAPSIISPSPST